MILGAFWFACGFILGVTGTYGVVIWWVKRNMPL
jgi:hypothetical protein